MNQIFKILSSLALLLFCAVSPVLALEAAANPSITGNFAANWPEIIGIGIVVVEGLLRVIPTGKNHSIILKVLRFADFLLANRAKLSTGEIGLFKVSETKRMKDGTFAALRK